MESMDLMDSDSSGIQLTTSVDDVSSLYTASYLESFLPAYQMVNQSALSSVADRYRAIKFAADASLALTAGGASWSDALRKMLVESSDRDVSSDDSSSNEEETFSRRSDADLSLFAASTSSREQSPVLNSSNAVGGPSGSFETESWRTRLGDYSLGHRRGGAAGWRMSVLQRFAGRGGRKNWTRVTKLSRDASRLAILRTLSSKCKHKRQLSRGSTKPRASVRKVKSLAKSRRRLQNSPKQMECAAEPEQTFENGLETLQRLVPGGSPMDPAVLLDEAADFIMFLKLQVQALQAVANAVGIDDCNADL